jgi:hypothetical protein
MTMTTQERPAAASAARAAPEAKRKVRRSPLTWYRGGGLANLLFVLPMLFVFFFFSW